MQGGAQPADRGTEYVDQKRKGTQQKNTQEDERHKSVHAQGLLLLGKLRTKRRGLGTEFFSIGRLGRLVMRDAEILIHRNAHLPADRADRVNRRIFDVAAKELGNGADGKVGIFGYILICFVRSDRLLLLTAQIR